MAINLRRRALELADQFDDDHSEERKKMSFNWWNSGLCFGHLLGVTVIVYVQDHVNGGIADIILTTVMTLSLFIGSPLTPMLQVLVAAISKRKLPYLSNAAELYEVPKSQMAQERLLCHTNKLLFLDRAAIIEDKGNSFEKQGPWRLATVNKVEEIKLVINMIPIWLPFGICVALIKQGVVMERKIGNLVIPSASIYSIAAIGMIISVTIYEKSKATGNEMLFSVPAMIVAALVEQKRLAAVKNDMSMSVFWLAPQFLIIGAGDGFAVVGLQEYFYDQVPAPDSMRNLGIAFYLSVIGAA